MTVNALMPREAVPSLKVPLTSGGEFDLKNSDAENFTLVVFYRGLHCPICAVYLTELERLAGDYAERGVNIIAVSSDEEDRANDMAEKIKADKIKMGYGLNLQNARDWGLYISTSRGKTSIGIEEPELFSEPGVFLVKPDGTLFYGSTQTMPFARPPFKDLLGAIDFSLANDYPARGEYTGEV